MQELEISQRQLEIISHSLGVNWYNALMSDRPKYKILPDDFYRSYFFTSEGSKDYDDLENLYSKGLCNRSEGNNGFYYSFKDNAIEYFKYKFKAEVSDKFKKPSKSKSNYIDYLEYDTCWSFSDYLGIVLPELEQCYMKGYRYVSKKYYGVKGEYCNNITNAKKSYKSALNEFLKRPDRKDFIINY